MQSFGVNQLDTIPKIPDDWIKSLSDDDDDQKDLELEQYYACVPLQKHIYVDDDHESDSTQESEEENETNLHHIICESQEEKNVTLLDKDKNVVKTLHNAGYKLLNKLCFTDQGSVWRATSPKSMASKSVVIKIASKLHYDANKSVHEDIVKEIELLQHLNTEMNTCPHLKNSIIQVLDTIETDENYMMVLEYGGCDLFQFISDCHNDIKEKKITIKEWQKTTRLIVDKMLQLLHWLHTKMLVCHSDISLENILISNIEWISYPDQYKHYKKRLAPHFQLKLIDFGAAQCFKDAAHFESCSIVGKPTYCCPQIYKLQNKLCSASFDARSADLWSFGVACFIIAIGCPPWQQPHEDNELFHTIVVQQNLSLVLKEWNKSSHLEEDIKDLLQNIFVMDEKKRINTTDIMEHNYF